MPVAHDNAWNVVRRGFADQFEPDGTYFIYRKSQIGHAFRITAAERDQFVEEFDRRYRLGIWIFYIGLTVALGAAFWITAELDIDSFGYASFVSVGIVSLLFFAYSQRVWSAPSRALERRLPIARKLSREEINRIRLPKISYGQIAAAGLLGVAIPFFNRDEKNGFSGANLFWLLFGGALVVLAVVQAFRKWRFERTVSFRDGLAISRDRSPGPHDAPVPVTRFNIWQFLPLGLLIGGIAFVFTPFGQEIAQKPWFWPGVMSGLGALSLATVAKGFSQGRVQPWARGLSSTYERSEQPKRYWASMLWNASLGVLFLWLSFQVSTGQSTKDEDLCYFRTGAETPQEVTDACNRLMKANPAESDAFLYRGLVFLDTQKYDLAEADFTRAHQLAPQSAWPLANRGLTYVYKNDNRRAADDFREARKIDPVNSVLARGEALMKLEAGEHEAAIALLNAQLAREPEDIWALRLRSDAHQQMGDFDKAKKDRDRADKLSGMIAR